MEKQKGSKIKRTKKGKQVEKHKEKTDRKIEINNIKSQKKKRKKGKDEKCEEVGVVKRVHTLLGGVHRLATALKEVEEVQEEEQEMKDE